ncbi:MAG: V-type ATPase subunit [bacterium]|nr:V-type ATPase subunit [bacterium]
MRNIIELWYDTYPHNIFDRELLEDITTPEILKKNLGNTFLGEVFQSEETPDFKTLESRIDYAIIINLFAFSKELFPEQRQIFFNIATRKIISLKIAWSNRLELIYGWDHARIEEYMFNIDELVNRYKEIQKAAPGLEIEIGKNIKERFQDISQMKTDDILEIEFFLEKDYWLYISKLFHKDFHAIYPVVSYLCLLYYQIQNLFCIIEGFHFNVPSDEIHKKIICED